MPVLLKIHKVLGVDIQQFSEDQEARLLAQLRDALAALWPRLRICALVEDGIQTLRAREEHKPDILFLDIQMPGLSARKTMS